jgi:hypothetical protein
MPCVCLVKNSLKNPVGRKGRRKECITCSKRSARGIWRATTPLSSATNSGEHSKIPQTHDLLTTRKARRKLTRATTTSKNPTKG